MPVSIVMVGKGGEIREARVPDVEPATLARKCGLKKVAGFSKRASWPIGRTGSVVELWAKTDGRAGTENKYDFPPPVDSTLFFGVCCLVAKSLASGNAEDFQAETWAGTYERLFGGFDDLTQEEEESEDELDSVPASMKTASGYLKDGFVTDGSGGEAESGDDDDEESAVSQAGDSDERSSDLSAYSDTSDGEGAELEEEEYDYAGSTSS